jgi:hypothetical protein
MPLQNLPRDTEITYMRSILFGISLPFSLTLANHNTFWPFIDNVYLISLSRDYPTAKPPYGVKYVNCRFKKRQSVVRSTPYKRQPRKRVTQPCDAEFKILLFTNHVEYWPIKEKLRFHNHSLEESDAKKRNLAIRRLALQDTPPAMVEEECESSVDKSKPTTNEILGRIQGRFLEVANYAESLEEPEKKNILDRWDKELGECLSPLIDRPLTEWISQNNWPNGAG